MIISTRDKKRIRKYNIKPIKSDGKWKMVMKNIVKSCAKVELKKQEVLQKVDRAQKTGKPQFICTYDRRYWGRRGKKIIVELAMPDGEYKKIILSN